MFSTGSTERFVDRLVFSSRTLSPDGSTLGGRVGSGGAAATLNLTDDTITSYSDPNASFTDVIDISANGTLLVASPSAFGTGIPYTINATGEVQQVVGLSFVNGLSEDGQTVTGEVWTCADGQGLCTVSWDINTRLFTERGNFRPLATNGTGSMIVGHGWSEAPGTIVVCDSTNGARTITDILTGKGVDLSGWSEFTRMNISDDGYKLAGFATNPAGDRAPFLINVIPQCIGL